MAKLSKQRQQFADEYLIDLNGTQAAIRAGYSIKTANEQAARLLANVSIQEAIARAMAERSKRTGICQDRIVIELARMAFVKITDVADENGCILDNASDDDIACVESIKVKHSETDKGSSEEREVKLSSKVKALELLGKHLGMWNDKLNVSVTLPTVISGEDELED